MKKQIFKRFEKLKELYSNRRYRAMFILGFYLIFFIIIFAIFETDNKVTAPVDEGVESAIMDYYGVMDNYEYTYMIEQEYDDEEYLTYTVEGKCYEGKQSFNIKDDINGYYIENNNLYITRDSIKEKALKSPLSIDLLKIQPDDIVSFIASSQLSSTTEDFNEDTIKNSYILPVRDFMRLYFNAEVTDEDNKFINITTYEKEEKIVKVEMDLTNADKYEEYSIDFHKIELNYSNIGNVESLDEEETEDSE